MTTIYNTPRGMTYDPMVVEIWPWDGQGPIGRLETAESVKVTWADRTAGVAVVDAPLSELTRQLIPADGSMLLVVHLNGLRHVSSVVEAEPYCESDHRQDTRIKITTASAWSLLDGQRIPPVPDQPLNLQQSAEQYVLAGPVESVVKTLVGIGADRLGHPIAVMPDFASGPQVTIHSRNDTTADLVDKALTGTGYRLALDAWLPGDAPIGQLSLTRPTIVADVKPYRDVPGLVWSDRGEDLDSWSLKHTRATATRVIVGDKGEKTEQLFTETIAYDEPTSPWARRETYTEARGEGEDPGQAAQDELLKSAGAVTADVTVTPSMVWEYGADGQFPRQFQVGDIATVQLEGVGEIQQVVTEVTAELTPVSLTVTPKVATPDTRTRSLYDTVAELDKRLDRQQRR